MTVGPTTELASLWTARSDPSPSPWGTYFRTDTTRLTFRELWRISSRLPVSLAACLKKVLGLRHPARWAVCHEDAIRVVPASEILEPVVEEFQRLGARLVFYHTGATVGNLEAFAAVLLPSEHDAVILVTWVRAQFSGPGKESSGYVVTSHLQDGTFLSTTNHPRRLNTPPEYRVLRLRDGTPSAVFRRHQHALGEAESSAIRVRNDEEAKNMILEIKHRTFQWHVARGVWVPLTHEELARLGIAGGEVP